MHPQSAIKGLVSEEDDMFAVFGQVIAIAQHFTGVAAGVFDFADFVGKGVVLGFELGKLLAQHCGTVFKAILVGQRTAPPHDTHAEHDEAENKQ